jgi:hypothetical protein
MNGALQKVGVHLIVYFKVGSMYKISQFSPITLQIMLILFCMNLSCTSAIIDVDGAFLQGHFEHSKELYIEALDGLGEWYLGDVSL